MVEFRSSRTPKWIRLILASISSGVRIGTTTRMVALTSSSVCTASMITMISSRSQILCVVRPPRIYHDNNTLERGREGPRAGVNEP